MSIDCGQNLSLSPDFRKLEGELTLWATIKRFPLNATYELTPLCNLRCPMCYVRLDSKCMAAQGKQMSAKEWLEIARQSAEMGTLFVTLTGGEPLLHPEFWEIYNGMTELGLLVSVNTNGCLIDEETVERFKANPPYNMKLSLYGASNETYESMCGVKDGFTRVSRAIDLLNASGLTFFCTSTVVHENFHDLEAMYRFAHEKRIKFYHTTAVTLSARGALSDPLKSRTTIAEEGWTLELLNKRKRTTDNRPFARCGGYATSYFMTWHGHMQFCGFSSTPYVQVKTPVDLPTAWTDMLAQTDAIKIPEECATCEHADFCMRCPGLLAAESGDPEKVCESFCSMAAEMHRVYDELMAREAEKAKNGDLPLPDDGETTISQS
jgi:MoaA/NifB/PqqE/SkfB family radical SAM enzyme